MEIRCNGSVSNDLGPTPALSFQWLVSKTKSLAVCLRWRGAGVQPDENEVSGDGAMSNISREQHTKTGNTMFISSDQSSSLSQSMFVSAGVADIMGSSPTCESAGNRLRCGPAAQVRDAVDALTSGVTLLHVAAFSEMSVLLSLPPVCSMSSSVSA